MADQPERSLPIRSAGVNAHALSQHTRQRIPAIATRTVLLRLSWRSDAGVYLRAWRYRLLLETHQRPQRQEEIEPTA